MAENFMLAVEETMREGAKEQQSQSQQGAGVDSVVGPYEDSSNNMKGYLPQLIAESLRSEDDYFLPFDDDNIIPNEGEPAIAATPTTCDDLLRRSPPPPLPEKRPQVMGRDAAVAALGEFFLCKSSVTSPSSQRMQLPSPLHESPVSTIEIDRALVLEQYKVPRDAGKSANIPNLTTESVSSDNFHGSGSLSSVSEEVSEEGVAAFSKADPVRVSCSPRRFIKLSHANRTTSLPLDLTPTFPSATSGTPTRLTRRSSLKRISSYGKFPPSKSSNSLKRNVSFGNMQIREYNVALSDHPSCSYGPPIQLSWEYKEKEAMPLESYEASREGNRRQGHSLLLSFYERHFMLIKQAGYSKREIKETMREVERVKRERQVTDLFLAASPIDETMEHVLDTVKQFFRRPQGADKNFDHGVSKKEAVIKV
jgi:hypothetical protein